jgi:hypothetical protein
MQSDPDNTQRSCQELLACCTFLLLDKRRVGWEPIVVVRIEMGILETLG